MKIHLLITAMVLSALVLLFTGCDGSRGSAPLIENTSVSNPDPGTEILPWTPPEENTPPSDGDPIDDGGDDTGSGGGGGGSGGAGGDLPPGGDQEPVPEPSTLVLVGSGIALISLCRKKKREQENETNSTDNNGI